MRPAVRTCRKVEESNAHFSYIFVVYGFSAHAILFEAIHDNYISILQERRD